MRCYACDRQNAGHNDTDTGRHYCSTCWNVIEDLMKTPDSDIEGESILTSGIRYVTLEAVLDEEEELNSVIKEALGDAPDMS